MLSHVSWIRLEPYAENPPDRVITHDDIVFCDFGPIFEEWEADFGRTFVLGDDPVKHQLREDLPEIWGAGRRFFDQQPDITGEQLFAHVVELSSVAGWEFGGSIAGHLVGQFPHEKIAGDKITYYIAPGSTQPMRRADRNGQTCHWILEVHLVDRTGLPPANSRTQCAHVRALYRRLQLRRRLNCQRADQRSHGHHRLLDAPGVPPPFSAENHQRALIGCAGVVR